MGIFWTFPSDHFGGYAAAAGIAMINSLGNLGGFAAPSLKVAAETYTGSAAAGLWIIGGGALAAAILVLLIPLVKLIQGADARNDLLEREVG